MAKTGHHHHRSVGQSLWTALVITLGFAVVEAITGWLSGSLALLGDAGHMVSDSAALGIATVADRFSRRPPSERHSYGFGRIEVVAAMANALFMLVIVVGIATAAVNRLFLPKAIHGETVITVAGLGLLANLFVAWWLSHGEQTLNSRGALLHVLGDLLGSIAALFSGVVISATGWTPIDSISSMVICILILFSSVQLLREALHVVMEGVPSHLSLNEVGVTMSALEGVKSVHDLHIWTLSSGHIALSAHVIIEDLNRWEKLLHQLHEVLRERFGIQHTTLQPEPFVCVLQHVPLSSLRRGTRGYKLDRSDGGNNSK